MKFLRKWLRILHRDIGFVATGFCLVYGISGIVLNHLGKNDPAYKTYESTIQLSTNLSAKEVENTWKGQENLPDIKRVTKVDDENYKLLIDKGIGVYSTITGIAEYEQYKRKPIIYFVNKLHYNKVKGWTIMADFFAASLIFLAISGLIIVKGKKGLSGSGKWFVIIGLLIPLAYIFFM